MPSSSGSRTTPMTSDTTWDMTLYSTSELDLDTVCCFLDFQQIGDIPYKRRYLLTELLVSRQDAQFDS